MVQRTINVRQDYNCLNTTQHKLNYVVSISKAVRPCGVGLWWEGKRKGKCCQHNSEWFPAVARHGVDYIEQVGREREKTIIILDVLYCMQRSLTVIKPAQRRRRDKHRLQGLPLSRLRRFARPIKQLRHADSFRHANNIHSTMNNIYYSNFT